MIMQRRLRPLKFVHSRRSGAGHQMDWGGNETEYDSQALPVRISKGGLKLEFFKNVLCVHACQNLVVCLRTEEPVLPSNGLEYFELKVFTKKRELPASISVGLSSLDPPWNLPGLEKGSFGYQGKDGSFWYTTGNSQSNLGYAPPVFHEDTVGCGVDFVNNSIFFTKNGINLGVVYSGSQVTRRTLYFTVGVKGPSVDYVLANFGASPFLFDLDNVIRFTKNVIFKEIHAIQLPSFPQDKAIDFNQLILAYLLDNGCVSTAESFARAAGININSFEETHYRSHVRQHILRGQMAQAVNLVNHRYPDFFKSRAKLLFRLRVQQFVDLLMSYKQKLVEPMETDDNFSTEIYLDFSELHTLGCDISRQHAYLLGDTDDEETLTKPMKQAFALLAYKIPEKSPFASLINPRARVNAWEELKKALIECSGPLKFNSLEILVRHNALLMETMSESGIGASAFVDQFV